MGKCGAGKSTVCNQLVGHDLLSNIKPPFTVSQQVLVSTTHEVSDAQVGILRGNVQYEITVIDTVGLFDTEIKEKDPIFNMIEEYLKDRIQGINLILFVFKRGRLTEDEKEVFSFIKSRFLHSNSYSNQQC